MLLTLDASCAGRCGAQQDSLDACLHLADHSSAGGWPADAGPLWSILKLVPSLCSLSQAGCISGVQSRAVQLDKACGDGEAANALFLVLQSAQVGSMPTSASLGPLGVHFRWQRLMPPALPAPLSLDQASRTGESLAELRDALQRFQEEAQLPRRTLLVIRAWMHLVAGSLACVAGTPLL